MNTENNQETPLIESHLAHMQGWDAPLNYSHIEKSLVLKLPSNRCFC